MADRTSAGLFAKLFELLAKNPTEEHKEIAREMYNLTSEYDFSDYQMCADDACLTLGIARRGVNPEYPEHGVMTLWPGEDGYEDAQALDERVPSG